MMSHYHVYHSISMLLTYQRQKEQRGYFMTKNRTRLLLVWRNQRLLKHRTCLSDVMQQSSFHSNLFIKSLMLSHNTSRISNILQMLTQTNTTILLAFS